MVLWASCFAAAVILPVLHGVVPHDGLHHAIEGASASDSHHDDATDPGAVWGPGAIKRVGGEASKRKPKSNCPKNPAPVIQDGFPQPEFRRSRNGKLSTELEAATVPTQIAGGTYVSSVYEGTFPGPTLVVCPGDLMKVHLQNSLNPANFPAGGPHPGITNLHTHGFHVSPHVPSDNVFVEVPPGDGFDYRYQLPRDHPPGAYWYHPHLHGETNVQAFGGMAGAMIVQGGLDEMPGYRDIPTRVLVIQQTALGDGVTIQPGPTGPFTPPGSQIFVNGQLNPEIKIKPGELQRWRIYNASAGQFVDLQLEGQNFELLANDGNNLAKRTSESSLLISPSSRREVLVRGGPEGSYELLALPFAQTGGAPPPQETLATLVSSGAPVDDAMPPKKIDKFPDLRKRKPRATHVLDYTQEPPNFFINGQQFDPKRVDQMMRLGKVEEWTINNQTSFWHTFHIHINDFQLIEVNGEPVDGVQYHDNVSVSPGGSFTMRTRPTQYKGKFVFHCHVLGHEDNGMMGVVRIK